MMPARPAGSRLPLKKATIRSGGNQRIDSDRLRIALNGRKFGLNGAYSITLGWFSR
jgi:hypothetical protein